MGYVIEATEWPEIEVPATVRNLIDTFFSLLDNPTPSVGDMLADEIFTSHGTTTFGGKVFVGRDGERAFVCL